MWPEAMAAALRRWRDANTEFELGAVAKHHVLYQLAASAISFATSRIKRQVYNDKQQFLQQLIGDGLGSVGDLLHRVKQHGLGGRQNKGQRKPLPKLCGADGRPATSRQDRDAIWLDHFIGAQECGETTTVAKFLDQPDKGSSNLDELQRSVQDLPTIAGPFAATQISGHDEDPSSHRSLYVSSTLAKVYHKLMRPRGQPALQTTLHGLHLGSQRGAPLSFVSTYRLTRISSYSPTAGEGGRLDEGSGQPACGTSSLC